VAAVCVGEYAVLVFEAAVAAHGGVGDGGETAFHGAVSQDRRRAGRRARRLEHRKRKGCMDGPIRAVRLLTGSMLATSISRTKKCIR
jgi:hypothetical protein